MRSLWLLLDGREEGEKGSSIRGESVVSAKREPEGESDGLADGTGRGEARREGEREGRMEVGMNKKREGGREEE